jgi:hypothetical protein
VREGEKSALSWGDFRTYRTLSGCIKSVAKPGVAVPNFLEAQVRAKISRAQSDMRSIATAIEPYRVDENAYPLARDAQAGTLQESNGSHCDGLANINYTIAQVSGSPGTQFRISFAVSSGLAQIHSLTTPVSYITSYPADPFADTKGLVYGYTQMNNNAWLLWSYGPDMDEKIKDANNWQSGGGGQIGMGINPNAVSLNPTVRFNFYKGLSFVNSWECDANTVYSPSYATPTATLLTAGYTYDSTNGSKSTGDIWRAKQ